MWPVSAAPPTVLAVDDDPVVRDCLGLVLNEHCELVLAADGIEAIETMRSRSFDVVLLDLIMPRMNGHEALAHMHREYARTPVIVLTAVADVRTVVAAIKHGAWDYVAKPWEDEVLITLVHRAARERRGQGGVLLVSDSIASLAPLQLALEPQTQVLTTSVAQALRFQFLPTAIVLECAPPWISDTVRSFQDRFPKTPIIIPRQNGSAPVDQREGFHIDGTIESSSVDGVPAELARICAINHATVATCGRQCRSQIHRRAL